MPEVVGDRFYKKLPYISKSSIKTHSYFCPYLFYNNMILKEKKGEMGKRADVGTDTHLIFSEFWKKVDCDYIYNELEIDTNIELENNPITYYFYGICMKLTPDYDRDVDVLQRIFWKFAQLHAARFLYFYKLFNGNRFKVWKYFYPIKIEDFFITDDYEIYGTIDTSFKDCDKNLNESVYVPDYKTGKVPVSVLRGPKNIADETSVQLPPKFMFEVHFYGLLYLLEKHWDFNDERVNRFVLYDEYRDKDGNWKTFGLGITKEEQEIINKKKYKYLTKLKLKLKRWNPVTKRHDELKKGDIILGIIFLTGDPKIQHPVVAKKKFNYTSLKTVLVRINTLRQIYFHRNDDEFYLIKEMKTRPEYNEYRCKVCSRNEKCLKEIEEDFKRGL